MHVTRPRLPAALCTVLFTLLSSTWLYAQTASMRLYVFNKGTPVHDIEVLVDNKLVALTDRRGVAELNLEPGIHYLEMRIEDHVVLDQQILAIRDEVTQ